jgi:hypothetical protein
VAHPTSARFMNITSARKPSESLLQGLDSLSERRKAHPSSRPRSWDDTADGRVVNVVDGGWGLKAQAEARAGPTNDMPAVRQRGTNAHGREILGLAKRQRLLLLLLRVSVVGMCLLLACPSLHSVSPRLVRGGASSVESPHGLFSRPLGRHVHLLLAGPGRSPCPLLDSRWWWAPTASASSLL